MKEIPLTQGKVTLVDDEDFEYLNQWKWYYDNCGYARRSIHVPDQGAILMHRAIVQTPDDMETDHINGNKLDNQRTNLRICTMPQNRRNRRAYANNTSGFKGVVWNMSAKKWEAYIRMNIKRIYLGLFADPAEAARAYDKAATQYYGEFANLNFPEGATA